MRKRALALVHAAPMLCAKLPLELLEAVASELLKASGWYAFAAPCARRFLPPQDDTFQAAADRSDRAEGQATLTLDGTVGTGLDGLALDDESYSLKCRAHAPCVAELHQRIARRDRWLRSARRHIQRQIVSHHRVASDPAMQETMFTASASELRPCG